MFQILHKTNIDFMGWKNVSFAVSAIMITLGIVALVQIGRGKANMGIDFVGGTTMQLNFKQPVAIDKARAALEKSGLQGAAVQEVGEGGNNILIRMRESEGVSDKVQTMFRQEFPDNPFEVYSIMEIGPAIGKSLQRDSLLAITISIIGIVIYIAFRFQFKFGVAAAIATIHDVFAVLAIFYLLQQGDQPAGHHRAPDAGRVLAHGHGRGLRPHQGEHQAQQAGAAAESREQQHQRSAVQDDHHLAHGGAGARSARALRRRRPA